MAEEIFMIAAVMFGLVLIGLSVGFAICKVQDSYS